jgi:N-acetylmuramoyl-L-alanine amidase
MAATASQMALGVLPQIGNRKVKKAGLATFSRWRRRRHVLQMQVAAVGAAESPDPSCDPSDDYLGSGPVVFNSTRGGGRTRGFVFIALTFVLAAYCGLAVAQDAEPIDPTVLPVVLDARVTSTAERARLILDLSAKTEFAIATLDEPNRIAIDVRAGGLEFAVPPDVAGTGVVAAYTVEMAEGGRARTLLALSQPAQVQQAYVLEAVADQPARLVVDVILDTPENFAARAAADRAASLALRGAVEPVTASIGTPDTTAPQTTAPDPGNAGTFRPLVVIDPGHGGVDNGASAGNGVHEKDIVLAFALDLQSALSATGKFDVALTREDDAYLTLDERVAIARQNKADLFISLHADSFQQPEIRGASIYTRDERATDILDKILADNENKTDIIAGFAVPEMQPAVVDILVDLMRRQMRRESFLAAQAIVKELEPSVSLRRFPVRQADFFVLQAPDVPSILVELGFLSNAADIANLQKSDWRDRVVGALSRGIDAYFNTLQQPVVAQQR